METTQTETKNKHEHSCVQVNDVLVISHCQKVAVRTELDDRRVRLSGRVLGLQHQIFDLATGVNSSFPATEAAGPVANGKAVAADVEIDAHDRIEHILAEYTCVINMRQKRRVKTR